MSEELKIGSVIKMTPEEAAVIEPLLNHSQTARLAFTLASENVKETMDRLWDAIHELYPELGQFRAVMKHPRGEDMRLVVVGRLHID